MRKDFIIIICLLVKFSSAQTFPEQVLRYVFIPDKKGQTYELLLDSNSDTLSVDIPIKGVKKFKLDSSIVAKIFNDGKKLMESFKFEPDRKATVGSSTIEFQISYNFRRRLVDITDEYYFNKAKEHLTEINSLIDPEYRIPFDIFEFSGKNLNDKDKKYLIGPSISISQTGAKPEKEFWYDSFYDMDTMTLRVFQQPRLVKRFYVNLDERKSVISGATHHFTSFKFGQGHLITSPAYNKRFKISMTLNGLHIEDSYASEESYKNDKSFIRLTDYINTKIIREKVLE